MNMQICWHGKWEGHLEMGPLTYNGRRKINTCTRRGKCKTFTVPAILHSIVQESSREWWRCVLQGAYGQWQHTKSPELLLHLQAVITPRRWKAGILLCACQKNPRGGKPVQQGLSSVTWVPGAQVLNSLHFPVAAVFPGALLGWDPVQETSQCNFLLTALTTQQVRYRLRLPVFARIFHLFTETSVQKSSQSEEQEIKSGSCVPE